MKNLFFLLVFTVFTTIFCSCSSVKNDNSGEELQREKLELVQAIMHRPEQILEILDSSQLILKDRHEGMLDDDKYRLEMAAYIQENFSKADKSKVFLDIKEYRYEVFTEGQVEFHGLKTYHEIILRSDNGRYITFLFVTKAGTDYLGNIVARRGYSL